MISPSDYFFPGIIASRSFFKKIPQNFFLVPNYQIVTPKKRVKIHWTRAPKKLRKVLSSSLQPTQKWKVPSDNGLRLFLNATDYFLCSCLPKKTPFGFISMKRKVAGLEDGTPTSRQHFEPLRLLRIQRGNEGIKTVAKLQMRDYETPSRFRPARRSLDANTSLNPLV